MLYSNHQSFADICATLWLMKDHAMMGYVSKEEWRKYPILADVVEYSRSIYLIRNNPKEAVKALGEAKKMLDMGFNLCIFPEGTRSQCHEMGEFKAGAFKFAEKGKVPILPVTLDGGYKLFEEKRTYQPAHIKITVHPLVHIEKMSKEINKMKQDSIALINQITTISKQRLFDDIILRKVHLSSNSLDLIDARILKFFTK